MLKSNYQNDNAETKIFRVTHIVDGKITVAGNHPFASKTIAYNIAVKKVRDTTADKLKQGVENMNALHQTIITLFYKAILGYITVFWLKF